MKTMKRLCALALLMLAAVLLTACTEKQPSVSRIQRDVNAALAAEYEGLSDGNVEILYSELSDRHYTLELEFKAEGRYATFTFDGTAEYTRFDQGWEMTSCDLSKRSYRVIHYPDSQTAMKEMNEIWGDNYSFEFARGLGDNYEVFFSEPIETWAYTHKNILSCLVTYDPANDVWNYSHSIHTYDAADSHNLVDFSGEYSISGDRGRSCSPDGSTTGVCTISDVTDNSVTISGGPYEQPTVFTFGLELDPDHTMSDYVHWLDDEWYHTLNFITRDGKRYISIWEFDYNVGRWAYEIQIDP